MTDVVGITALVGAGAELTGRWVAILDRAGDVPSLRGSDAVAFVDHVITALTTGAPVEHLDDARLPRVDELSALRRVLNQHALSGGSADAIEVVTIIDDLIDDLIRRRSATELSALERAAFLDPLTGVANRRALDRDLAREVARAARHHRPLAVAAIDVDGLKVINDRDGHGAGDECLRRLTAALRRGLRGGDTVFRVGGDEFVVVLPDTGSADVEPLLTRVRAQAPSFSFGLASAPDDGLDAPTLLRIADERLLSRRRHERSRTEPIVDLRTAPVENEPSGSLPPLNTRPSVAKVRLTVEAGSCDAHVTLSWGDRQLVGDARGSSASTAQRTLVASAVVQALTAVDPTLASAHVVSVNTSHTDDAEVVLVHVVIPGSAVEEHLVGAALVHTALPDAITRAVLDALNRRLVMRHPHPAA